MGLDIAPGTIARARETYPERTFVVGTPCGTVECTKAMIGRLRPREQSAGGSVPAPFECISLPAKLREERQAQLKAHPELRKRFGGSGGTGFAEPTLIRTPYVSAETLGLLDMRVKDA